MSEVRERLLRHGSTAVSDAELVSLLLRCGHGNTSAVELAHALLSQSSGLLGLSQRAPEQLRVPGVADAKIATVLAAVEIGRRLARSRVPERQPLSRPSDVASYLALRYQVTDQEVMGALYLDTRNRLIEERELFRGALARMATDPRTVLHHGLLHSAAGFILFHTHPSGDPSPSAEDLAFTRRMATAGDTVGIHLLDHLILGSPSAWVSLKRRGGW